MHPHVYLDRKLAQCAPAPTSQVHYFTVKVVLEVMLQSSSKFNTGIFTSVILKLCHLIVHLFVYCRRSSFSSSDSVFSPFLHPHCQASIKEETPNYRVSAQHRGVAWREQELPESQLETSGIRASGSEKKRALAGPRWRNHTPGNVAGKQPSLAAEKLFLNRKNKASYLLVEQKEQNTYQHSNQVLVSNNSPLSGVDNGI